ncbi:MAG: hypothetical protein MUC35_03800 [Candidatus Margulisbacteria bacterium]|jgi:hypothetical protein|nr:hypothetical protein [Candidatus Margulisiibacteriota bacterium]
MSKLSRVLLIGLLIGWAASPVGAAPADLPQITPVGSREINFGQSLVLTLNATDPKGQPVYFDAANLPKGAILNPRGGQFVWTPSIYQLGTYRVTFAAWDRLNPRRMANETVNVRVVFRQVYNTKGWGLSTGQQEVLYETTELRELYPAIAALGIDGRPVEPTAESVAVGDKPVDLRIEFASPYNIDKKSIVIVLDGEKQTLMRQSDIKTYGADGRVISLVVECQLPALKPGNHSLLLKARNELGVTQRVIELRAGGKAAK